MTSQELAEARAMLRATWTAPLGATPEKVEECFIVERMHQAIALVVKQGLPMAAFLEAAEDAFVVEECLQQAEKALDEQQTKQN